MIWQFTKGREWKIVCIDKTLTLHNKEEELYLDLYLQNTVAHYARDIIEGEGINHGFAIEVELRMRGYLTC